MSDKCPTCDRTLMHLETRVSRAAVRALRADGLCLSPNGFNCKDNRVDWRARALAAEARLVEVEAAMMCPSSDHGHRCSRCDSDVGLAALQAAP